MASRIHLHLINTLHTTQHLYAFKDVSVKCAMPPQLICMLQSPQILHNSLMFTTANLVVEKTSNEIRWRSLQCSVTLHLSPCICAFMRTEIFDCIYITPTKGPCRLNFDRTAVCLKDNIGIGSLCGQMRP